MLYILFLTAILIFLNNINNNQKEIITLLKQIDNNTYKG